MTAQDKVFECFPHAEIRLEPAILLHGADPLAESADWVIYTGPEFDAEDLGRGKNPVEAWADAAGLLGNQAA